MPEADEKKAMCTAPACGAATKLCLLPACNASTHLSVVRGNMHRPRMRPKKVDIAPVIMNVMLSARPCNPG